MAKEFTIHTPAGDNKLRKLARTRSTSIEDCAEEGKHSTAFTFASSFFDIKEYFVVRGQKSQGPIIDPGAASGLVGSETGCFLLPTYEASKTKNPGSDLNYSAMERCIRLWYPLEMHRQKESALGESDETPADRAPPLNNAQEQHDEDRPAIADIQHHFNHFKRG